MTIRCVRYFFLGFLTPRERSLYNQLLVGRYLSTAIRLNRKHRGMTQAELAGKAGVSIALINRLERYWTVNVHIKKLFKIAKALDVALHVTFETWEHVLREAAAVVSPVQAFDEERLAGTAALRPAALAEGEM